MNSSRDSCRSVIDCDHDDVMYCACGVVVGSFLVYLIELVSVVPYSYASEGFTLA